MNDAHTLSLLKLIYSRLIRNSCFLDDILQRHECLLIMNRNRSIHEEQNLHHEGEGGGFDNRIHGVSEDTARE